MGVVECVSKSSSSLGHRCNAVGARSYPDDIMSALLFNKSKPVHTEIVTYVDRGPNGSRVVAVECVWKSSSSLGPRSSAVCTRSYRDDILSALLPAEIFDGFQYDP